MSLKVTKFGGSSLADANQFRRVKEILLADDTRHYVVPSAPGKRHGKDQKVTDLLYACHERATRKESFDDLFAVITARYVEIAEELRLHIDIQSHLDTIAVRLPQCKTADYAASRGEYLNGLLLADYMGWPFLDPADAIFFNDAGRFDSERTQHTLSKALARLDHAVVPGFYGSMPDGAIKTFSRGGSDITGAIVSRAAAADVYENWTDVSGFLMADPRIVENPKRIDCITYRELRELSYMGAGVLHEDAIFPVRKAGIPINIRNTNDPENEGTWILPRTENTHTDHMITGIAGHKDFAIISVEKAMMNAELGFGRRVLQAVEDSGISFEHLPTGIDTMCVVVSQAALTEKREMLIRRIYELTDPDSIEVHENLALIATVGRGMVSQRGTASRLFDSLYRAGINIRMIDQGSSELNIIVGVSCDDFERAVRAIYSAFVS